MAVMFGFGRLSNLIADASQTKTLAHRAQAEIHGPAVAARPATILRFHACQRGGLIAPVAEESQQEQEEVDEIEVQGQRPDDGVRPGLSSRHGKGHRLQSLRVVSGQPRKDDDPDKRNHELQTVALPEDADDRGQHDADKTHEQELPETRQAAARDGAVHRQRAEHPRSHQEGGATDSPVNARSTNEMVTPVSAE